MAALVSLREAKQHLTLPVDVTAADGMIQILLDAAEAICLTYVNQNRADPIAWALVVNGWTADTAPAQVRTAILIQLGELYKNRGDDEEAIARKHEPGELDRFVTALLYPFRDPAIA